MRKIFFILFLFISSLLNATIYYVATNGDDDNAGTIDAPFATWGKGFTIPSPGDTVYFRGGVYPMDIANGVGYTSINDGVLGDTIKYLAYPNETPILDCDAIIPSTNNYGIHATTSYCYFKGLTIRNVWQNAGYGAIAWYTVDSHTTYEHCTAYNIHGAGFWVRTSNELYYINCDAYNCCDSLSTTSPGNDGYGFMNYNYTLQPSMVYYTNCRAWNCGDDGFQTVSWGYTEYNGCWSFCNGQLQGAGNGFKLGLSEPTTETPDTQKLLKNCLAVYNKASGITTNDNTKLAKRLCIVNNTIYKNGNGFSIYTTTSSDEAELLRVFKNNVNYLNTTVYYIKSGALYTHSNNSWDSDVTVTYADFVSVDSTGLTSARGEDGSLPDLDFLELVSTSDLIDAGTDVGLTYYNDAPDIGFFEYPTFPETAAPYINTNEPVITRSRDVTAGGNMIFDGGGTISSKGVCISQQPDPDISDTIIYAGTGTADFTIRVPNLTKSTTYHLRAYATNETGTAYGADVEFTTPASSPVQTGGKFLKHGNYFIKIE